MTSPSKRKGCSPPQELERNYDKSTKTRILIKNYNDTKTKHKILSNPKSWLKLKLKHKLYLITIESQRVSDKRYKRSEATGKKSRYR